MKRICYKGIREVFDRDVIIEIYPLEGWEDHVGEPWEGFMVDRY